MTGLAYQTANNTEGIGSALRGGSKTIIFHPPALEHAELNKGNRDAMVECMDLPYSEGGRL